MQGNITVHHVYPDQPTEGVKLEKNTKGYNWEIRAATVERAFELDAQVRARVSDLGGGQ